MEFKAQVIQACRPRGVSVASVALAHGLNANLVRRWLNGQDIGLANALARNTLQPVEHARAESAATFVPVQLGDQRQAPEIRLELRRGPATVIVNWPAQDGAACGAWLRDWLR